MNYIAAFNNTSFY